ncbi:MAG TPA: PD-(D/E)XK nuclease family protein, partial [Flavobacterium sp.]|nr:PD-(D/E)XK nuclease family protein [Flavobacterium sp.]
NLAANTFGTIIHETLKALYTPFINSFLTVEDINQMLKEYEKEVRNQFKEIYKEGEINKGKNLLAFEVAKRNVYNFLQQEKLSLDEGDAVKILFLEHTFTRLLEDDRLPFSVNIGGNLDRVEQRNGKIRIVDYKTGKVEQRNLDLSDWNGLTSNIKNEKTIQLLCYAFMLEKDFQDMEIEAGIISFKNMKAGFMPFRLKEDKKIISEVVSKEMINQFVVQIIGLINEILDPNIPFEEKLI